MLCFALVFEQHRDSGVCLAWFKGKRVGKALRGPKCQERGRLEHVAVAAELQTPSRPSILLKQVVHLSHTGLCLLLALAMLQVSVPESVVRNAQRKLHSMAEELLAHQWMPAHHYDSKRLHSKSKMKRFF